MLCFSSPHGMLRRIHSRREHRKQRRRQKVAMEEARAAGWQPYCEEEYDSSEDELNALNEAFGIVSPSPTTTAQIPLQSNPKASTTDANEQELTAVDEDSDEEDDDETKDDATALDVEGIDQVLAQLELQHPLNSSSKPPTSLIATITSPYHCYNEDDSESEQELENETQDMMNQGNDQGIEQPSTQRQVQMISPFYEGGGEYTETTVDATETEATSDESAHVDVECAPSTSLRRNDEDNDSSSEDSDDDDDSLDLGVPTSMWPSLENSNNVHISGAFPTRSKSPLPSVHISNLTRDFFVHEENPQALDDENSVEDINEGTQVFLAKEGARYTGNQNDAVLEMGNIDSYCEDGIPAFRNNNPEHLEVNKLFQQNEADWKDHESNENGSQAEDEMNQDDDDDDPLFKPRYEEDKTNNDLESDLQATEYLASGTDEAIRENHEANDMQKIQKTPAENTCFGNLQLVTTKEFEEAKDENAVNRKEPVTPSLMSPLSSMVFFMDVDLYVDKTKKPVYKDCDVSVASDASDNFSIDSVASAPVHRNPGRLLNSEKYIIEGIHSNDRRSRLSSSFKSSTRNGRAAYSLSAGKKAMSKSEIALIETYLPHKPLLEISGRSNVSKRIAVDRSLYVLLVETSQKIFEVVKVDVDNDTKVGDVLAKARASATDPTLSEQKYTSLCKAGQEFAAPMLPVNLLIDWSRNKSSPLVVAVPVRSSAAEMQMIKHVLWQNPKLKRWWKQKDPFQPRSRRGRTEKQQNPSTPDTIPETPPPEAKVLDSSPLPNPTFPNPACFESPPPSLQECSSHPSMERFEL